MDDRTLDVTSNRKAVKYTRKEQLKRILWAIASPLFRYSPRTCFRWRSFLLRLFGAKIGHETYIYNSATIYMPWNLEIGDQAGVGEHAYIYNLGRITIGNKAGVSQRAHLCAGTHDFTDPAMPLLKPPICIKDQAWICADAFVGPGVTVGEGAIVGARTVVVKDVEPWMIVAGNPAKVIKPRIMKSRSQSCPP